MMPEERPVVALLYDFDKTLCTKDMQEYTFIPEVVNMRAKDFWNKSGELAKSQGMDGILAYMHTMLQEAKYKNQPIGRDDFVALGKDLELYPGVEGWFERVNQFGEQNDVQVEHYIISSGLREIIQGSSIYDNFHEVFACEFFYDASGVACWPKNVVNYTTKTQFLYRINKGILDLSDEKGLNKYMPEDDRPVPFRNMIYIGDGLTDVPCMKLVKVNGGYSIAVYPAGKMSADAKALLRDGRVDFLTPANYSEGSELDGLVRDMIRKMAVVDSLKKKSKQQMDALKA